MSGNTIHKKIELKPKTQLFLIILCWAVYTFAYLGRYSYTSNSVPIQKYYGVGKDDFAIATTFFFFAYGAGQILNGLLCRRYNMKFMIFGSLVISAVINMAVFAGLPFSFIKYLWLLNGLSQSVLWASLIRVLSCYLDSKHMKTSVVFMSTTVSVGTFIIYGASALFALFDGFKYSFLLAAVLMSVVSVLWIVYFPRITQNARLENLAVQKTSDDDNASATVQENARETGVQRNSKLLSPFFWIITLFSIYAILTNYAKDGLTTWIPQILNEQYELSDSLSIILTIVLPMFGIFGALLALLFNKFIKNYSDLTGVFFALSALSVFGIVLLFKTDYWYLALLLFGLVNMFMHGANNVITNMLPLAMGKKYNAGLMAGLLNGACYVGSTLSQYLIALIAISGGWSAVMNVLLYSCVSVSVFSLILFFIRQVMGNKRKNTFTK